MSTKLKTQEEFLRDCKEVHGDKYDYSEAIYIKSKIKVKILCKKCREHFYQIPAAHTNRGDGCPRCMVKGSVPDSLERFLLKAFNRHGNTFDYSKVDYKASATHVTVVCHKHGDFDIKPNHLLSGRGCPSCACYGYRANLTGTLYILKCDNIVKIGITNRVVEERVREINIASGKVFDVVYSHSNTDGRMAQIIEKYALLTLVPRYDRCDQKYNGSTECFIDVDYKGLIKQVDLFFKILKDEV
jgi:hypothetical protein